MVDREADRVFRRKSMRGVARLGVAAIVLAAGLVALAEPAVAECPSGETPVPGTSGQICIPAVEDGGGGSGDTGGNQGGGPVTCSFRGSKVPCSDPDRGTWSQNRQCYLLLMIPQPRPESAIWVEAGGSPADGRMFLCIRPDVPGNPTYVFMRGGGAPNPVNLARRALGQLQLARPEIHLAPALPHRTYVGVDTWLWIPPGQWATLRKSVSAGATTVTVTAVPDHVVWDMGPSSKTCYSAGREWQVGRMSKGSTTSCSYKYSQVSDFEPGNVFKVTATLTYQVDWRCTGTCPATSGSLGQVDGLPSTTQEQVGERQSVVVNGKD